MRVLDWLLLASVMAACIPLPSNTDSATGSLDHSHRLTGKQRTTRATNARRTPSFLFLLGQFFGQTISETGQAVGNITRIFNDQFTTTTPSPDIMLREDDSNSTTETPPRPITRQQLFSILGNNYRGLVRLFNQEWQSAVEQSSKNVVSFQKELREAVRPFLLPNGNITKNQT